jgi:hypothetical protein
MKYIHTYDTIEEFERDYNDETEYTVASFDCELGRFTFVGEQYVEQWEMTVYTWTNGDVTLDTERRNPSVGNKAYNDDPDGDGTPFEPGDDDEYEEYVITAIQREGPEPTYIEPWISYTRENEKTNYNKPVIINFQPYGRFVFADFGVTQEKINTWIDMIDNEARPEAFGVLVLSNIPAYVYHDNNYIYFTGPSYDMAQISLHGDNIQVFRAADTK